MASPSHDQARDGELRRNYDFPAAIGGMGMIAIMANRGMQPPADGAPGFGAWNPGIQSQVPRELRHLATVFRPDNVFTSVAAALELQSLTGLPASELVAFRPQRLALHELLIRVTADFAVPDGSRIGDLGINFREIVSRLLERHLVPAMGMITAAYDDARREVRDAVGAALSTVTPQRARWDPRHIADGERLAASGGDPLRRAAHRTLARVMSALYAAQGHASGLRELIASVAADMVCNDHGGSVIGRAMEPLLQRAARIEGYHLLPRQEQPVIINTKGPSASGKSTLRPMQKRLAGDIGVEWRDFALISPDIWRKQLLDYGSLGAAYKYAGAFTAAELQIVDQKLDRYMAGKHQRGGMTHLLIDRFRFDSFAPDSDEAGSNLLTRFGHTVYLFFMITPPEMLVDRAWKRGLEFGRYKAVDDTLAHAVEAYTGIPDVFFTWVRRSDKQIQFEFLDNTVQLGERPRTVAFGDNGTFNILNVKGTLDIERFGRINVDATAPEFLYADRRLLEPEHNSRFLQRCVEEFGQVNFADQASGRIYLRIESGSPSWVDAALLQSMISDPDTLGGIRAVAPAALRGGVCEAGGPQALHRGGRGSEATLGQWGSAP
jgi:hypothetical protein